SQALEGARQAKESADRRRQRRQEEEALWPQLRVLAEHAERLQARLEQIRNQQAQLVDDLEQELQNPDSPLAQNVRLHCQDQLAALADVAKILARLEESQAKIVAQLGDVDNQMVSLRPLMLAKQQGRWWTWTWWRATFKGKVLARWSELQSRERDLHQTLADARQQVLDSRQKRRDCEATPQTTL